MAEPLHEPRPPESFRKAPDITDAEIARRNFAWGWALFGLFWVLFGGTIGVAFIWLWLS